MPGTTKKQRATDGGEARSLWGKDSATIPQSLTINLSVFIQAYIAGQWMITPVKNCLSA